MPCRYWGAYGKEFKKSISAAIGYERTLLPTELSEEDLLQAEAIPLVPLTPQQHTTEYHVLYGWRGGRRGGTHDG